MIPLHDTLISKSQFHMVIQYLGEVWGIRLNNKDIGGKIIYTGDKPVHDVLVRLIVLLE